MKPVVRGMGRNDSVEEFRRTSNVGRMHALRVANVSFVGNVNVGVQFCRKISIHILPNFNRLIVKYTNDFMKATHDIK